jgi:hypothetical protein
MYVCMYVCMYVVAPKTPLRYKQKTYS